MPSIIATILYLGGLAMFWLYFRISNNAQSSVPDKLHQGHVPADEYGEYLTDQKHELLRLANEPHRQCQREIKEEDMMLEFWDRVLDIALRTQATGQTTDRDGAALNDMALELCNKFLCRERIAAGRPHDWEHWEVAGAMIRMFWHFSLRVIARALRRDPVAVTSQDMYEADAELRAEGGYWAGSSCGRSRWGEVASCLKPENLWPSNLSWMDGENRTPGHGGWR